MTLRLKHIPDRSVRSVDDADRAIRELVEALRQSQDEIRKLRSEVDDVDDVTDHGDLDGLSDDDHTQYLRTDGTRNSTGVQRFEQGLTVGAGGGFSAKVDHGSSGQLEIFYQDTKKRASFGNVSVTDLRTLIPASSSFSLGTSGTRWSQLFTTDRHAVGLSRSSSSSHAMPSNGHHYVVMVGSGPATYTLQASPPDGSVVHIANFIVDDSGNDLTVSVGSSTEIVTSTEAASSSSTTITAGNSATFIFHDGQSLWYRF